MKFLQQLWANDHRLSEGPHQGNVFERFFRPLINAYVLDSQKGIQYTNILDLVQLSKKSKHLTPNEIRGQNKNLTKRILYFLSGKLFAACAACAVCAACAACAACAVLLVPPLLFACNHRL